MEKRREALRRAGITAETVKGKSAREIARLIDRTLREAGLGFSPAEREPDEVEQEEHVSSSLRETGLSIASIWNLVNSDEPYPQAIPVLIRLLSEDLNPHLKEGIVRALTVKEARGVAAAPLIEAFKRAPPDTEATLKWAIGNALSIVAADTDFEEIAALVADPRHGTSRQMMVLALGKMKNPRAPDVLIPLLQDSEIVGHAIIALGSLKAERARPYIKPFVKHPYGWIQTEARRALAKIERARERREQQNPIVRRRRSFRQRE